VQAFTPVQWLEMPEPVPSYSARPPKQVGGAVCIDFVNTVTWRGDPADPGERLTCYEELVYWAGHVGILTLPEVRPLLAEASRHPRAARSVLDQALTLREALARLFLGGDRTPPAEDLGLLNEMLAEAPQRSKLGMQSGRYAWVERRPASLLGRPLHSVLWSAADLLASGQAWRVRRCHDTRCGWLFLDTSRNHRRQWCAMDECGNRAKVRRHYIRQQTAGPGLRGSVRPRRRRGPISREAPGG
jgi:predicted RNA-binding Zn ribbon-like protein